MFDHPGLVSVQTASSLISIDVVLVESTVSVLQVHYCITEPEIKTEGNANLDVIRDD